MNPEMQTTLLNTYFLRALREQPKENDQLNAVEENAGTVPGSFWDDVNGGRFWAYLPKLIAKILEQSKENDQLNAVEDIASPVPQILLEYDQILKGGGKFWDDVNGGYLPEDLVLAARREEIDWVHSEGVCETVPMRECKDAGMKPLDMIWVDTDKSVDPTRKKKVD